MDKLKMHSPDLTQENIARIRDLFPGCVTEARDEVTGKIRLAVDFDQLRQELSHGIVEGPQERYRLDWPGKREALALANEPTVKTLRPALNESVGFDSTQNLFIEGDNLEALKIIQNSSLGSINLIYIDPPYNTGNDFVYNDNFSESADIYLRKSGQLDISGNKLIVNPRSNGRFHSDWLSMLYSRLKIAKSLLTHDGLLFVSIDDNESHNLKRMCDEIFGEENFIAECTVVSNPRGRQSDTYVANVHDKLIIYARSVESAAVNGMPLSEEQRAEFSLKDERGESYRLLGLRQRGAASNREDRPDMFFPIFVDPATQAISLEEQKGWEAVYPRKSDGRDGRWMWGKEKCLRDKSRLVARLIERRSEYDIFVKDYLNKGDGERTRKFKSLWDSTGYNNQVGTQEVKALFGAEVMSFPKPRPLIQDICRMGLGRDGTVLDFFAGSSTTAHAVLALNASDGGRRKFVMVQLPEEVDVKSPAFRAGFTTIAELSKERIRLSGKKIIEGDCHPDWNRDVGFRVLKVDTSNMKDVYYRPDELKQVDLLDMVDNVKEDRTAEDLLFQVLVDWGVDLTLPIRRETVQGKTVFFVDDNALVACFEKGVTEDLVKELAKREPLRIVFRDNGFVSDAVKINVEQIFRQLSPTTDVKSI
jgi:adenine-specific DNA-methyltransferase